MMNSNDSINLEMEEQLTARVIEPIFIEKKTFYSRFRQIFTLATVPNEKHYRPVFIIIMSTLHILIHLTILVGIGRKHRVISSLLINLWMLFLPCMRPTPSHILMRTVKCDSWARNTTCYYDDALKNLCSTFLYPHQLWRMVTVNFVHFNWLHLLFNVSRQVLLGILLERKYGSMRIFVAYWISNIGASLFALIKTRDGGVGASGAVYGLIVFFVVERLNAMRTNSDRRYFILLQLILFVAFPMTITTLTTTILNYNIGHSAHFGGALVGFLFGIGMFGCPCPWNNENVYYQMICRRTGFVFLVIYFVVTLSVFFCINASYVDWFLPNF
ncbi:hypothetical protein I4U23_004239 [Adineta vaga]|nr:hypothetical protein I4U23_004239 [Adineta vaga]